MKPSIIVYGVPNGKTRFAERIAKFYGLKNGGTFSLQTVCSRDYIYFDSVEFPSGMGILVKSFSEVADEINAAIPLTNPSSAPPARIGEYMAEASAISHGAFRWWNGEYWSVFYTKFESQENQNIDAARKSGFRVYEISWRGLSEEPIVID